MKANRNQIWANDRGEVGVGTLIVFIAMVLVAAVAAAVLINTSGTLQQRATQTGKEATQEVSSNMKVTGIYGYRDAVTDANLYVITINAELSAGALPMDFQKLIIRYSDGSYIYNYAWGAGAVSNTVSTDNFATTWIRGSGTNQVMQPGDLVELKFNLRSADLPPRTAVQILLIPETGTSVAADFKSPPTYENYKTVTLR